MALLTLVRQEPFPEIPGAGALGVPVDAPGRGNAEPLLFVAALDDLARDQGQDARPILWADALEAAGAENEQARCDLADAFGSYGLRWWSPDDEAGGRWTVNGKHQNTAAVVRRYWPLFRAAVLRGLNDREEMAGDARARIRSALTLRREEDASKRERDELALLNRSVWPVPLAAMWLAKRDISEALQSVRALADVKDWSLAGLLLAAVAVSEEAGGAGDAGASDPFGVLLTLCAAHHGLLLGVGREGSAGLVPIDQRLIESGALRFHGADYEHASAHGCEWSGVCVDRRMLLELAPSPAVLLMQACAVLAPREQSVSPAQPDGPPPISRGRPRHKRDAAAAAIESLWGEDGEPPNLKQVNFHLRKLKGDVQKVEYKCFNAALGEVRRRRADGLKSPKATLAQ